MNEFSLEPHSNSVILLAEYIGKFEKLTVKMDSFPEIRRILQPLFLREIGIGGAMYFEDLHHRLREHLRSRLQSGEITERRLARLAGLSQPHVHNVLKGVRGLSNELADQILRQLRISLLDLLTPEERGAPSRLWGSRAAPALAQARRGRKPSASW